MIDRAKKMRALLKTLGYPNISDLSKMITNGVIENCPITSAGVKYAEVIFGPDIASLKSKTVPRKPFKIKVEKEVIPMAFLTRPYCRQEAKVYDDY
jgi:hypothetical protein